MKKWYYVIIERRTRSHRHPSTDRETSEKWAMYHNLEADLKGFDQRAWIDEVELDEDEDINAYLHDADVDYYECMMDGCFDY